ncbi:hypothetical protein BGK67_03660 [Streptomyces subrutilus]|uniref:Major facilitator superfamily (MFS) profile domain-containing protein n=1 Tax=Streptomyces subrutilus TaxID=36818 RepID=A0A1E5Q115_9ACTN|nr:MFS transporter [Streptomyces subrutilus]OEJ35453.1 hypothetical protein BGK67_03660 [Streptomyces subrutilus]
MGVIALAQLPVLLDVMAFNIALPSVQAELDLSGDGLNPAVSAYVLAFGGLLLLGGHIADLVGAKRALVIGLAGFALASVLGGSAGDPGLLIAARALQGAFAALLTPSALSLVSTGFPDPRERARAFGIYAAVAAGGGALGLLTGGWLAEALSWRLALYACVPLAALALTGAATLLPGRPGRAGARFDWLGGLLGSAGTAALLYGLDEAGRLHWTAPLPLGLIAVGVLLLGAFLWWQAVASGPLLAPHLTRDRDRAGCVLAMALAGAGMLALLPTLTIWLQYVHGHGPGMTGVMILPVAASAVIAATQVAARLQHRTAPRVLIVSGLVTAAVGLMLLAGIDSGSGYGPHVVPGMLLAGFGTGLAFVPVFATATAGAAPRHSGAASGILLAAQQVGEAIGVVLLTGLITARLNDASEDDHSEALLHGYTDTLWWAAGALLLAALVAGLMVTARPPGAPGASGVNAPRRTAG